MAILLPLQYHFRHQYSMFLHDILAKIVIEGEKNGDFYHKFQLKNEDDMHTIESVHQEKILDTLLNLGYETEMNWILMKQIFVAVLSDFTQYIFTALDASTKGRLSVTFCLLRKPFKDNLLILEWLLANSDEFLGKFKSSDLFKDISIDKVTREKKLRIISEAIEHSSNSFISADFIYDLRYNKAKTYGFESAWQMANHLITDCKHYKTEEMNLNFVFSTYENKLTQWENLYFLLPTLMMHTVNICWSLYKIFQPQSLLIDDNLLCRLVLGYTLSAKESVRDFDDTIMKDLPLICQKCGREIVITKQIEESITRNGVYKCSRRHRNNFYFLESKH